MFIWHPVREQAGERERFEPSRHQICLRRVLLPLQTAVVQDRFEGAATLFSPAKSFRPGDVVLLVLTVGPPALPQPHFFFIVQQEECRLVGTEQLTLQLQRQQNQLILGSRSLMSMNLNKILRNPSELEKCIPEGRDKHKASQALW